MKVTGRLFITIGATVLMLGACTPSADQEVDEEAIVRVLVPWGDLDGERQLSQQVHDRQEQLMADCMSASGFQYIPIRYEAIAFGPGVGIDRAEYSRRFGFGISTNDETFEDFEERTQDAGDPNMEYQSSLSQERRILYSDAFDGCQQQVRSALPELPESFYRAADELSSRVRADPRVVEAEQEWQLCVRDATTRVLPEFSTLDEIVMWLSLEYERVKEHPEQLKKLQDLEREVAVAHMECEPSLLEAMREVADQLEPSFIEEHADVLREQLEFFES